MGLASGGDIGKQSIRYRPDGKRIVPPFKACRADGPGREAAGEEHGREPTVARARSGPLPDTIASAYPAGTGAAAEVDLGVPNITLARWDAGSPNRIDAESSNGISEVSLTATANGRSSSPYLFGCLRFSAPASGPSPLTTLVV